MTRAVVVDDDEQAGRLAARLLAGAGIGAVDVVRSVAAYHALAGDGAYDLVLLDIELGCGESGLDLARQALVPGGPAVVMVTGSDAPDVVQEAITLGAHGYVVKPYRPSELQIAARNALRRRELEQQAAAHSTILETMVDARTAELRSALTELERVQRVREQMLRNCSHELKTPLTPILGWASYLEHRSELTPEQVRRCAAVIAEQGRRLLTVVESLLAASAVADRRLPVPVVACDPVAVARTLADGRSQVRLSVHGEPPPVPLGELELTALLAQLLDNAARFAPDSTVDLELAGEPFGTRLTVRDHGPGLPAGHQRELLLEPFVQGDGTATRAVGGLGIGLYVAAGVVRGRGGRLALEDTPGGGLTVVVHLPSAVRTFGRRSTDRPPER